jgi:hypothetical protein
MDLMLDMMFHQAVVMFVTETAAACQKNENECLPYEKEAVITATMFAPMYTSSTGPGDMPNLETMLKGGDEVPKRSWVYPTEFVFDSVEPDTVGDDFEAFLKKDCVDTLAPVPFETDEEWEWIMLDNAKEDTLPDADDINDDDEDIDDCCENTT